MSQSSMVMVTVPLAKIPYSPAASIFTCESSRVVWSQVLIPADLQPEMEAEVSSSREVSESSIPAVPPIIVSPLAEAWASP